MNLHRLDLVSLSLFTLVERTGSISRGAELAHLAVGAASKRISDLEDTVGAELFERHSRGVTLTLAGQALHRHAQRILADVDHLAADLSDHASGILGLVRLVANTSAVTQFLPADLAGFVVAHAGIRIEMGLRKLGSPIGHSALRTWFAQSRLVMARPFPMPATAGPQTLTPEGEAPIAFVLDPHRKHRLLHSLDPIGPRPEKLGAIHADETRRRTLEPLLFG